MKFARILLATGLVAAGSLLGSCGDNASLKSISAKLNNEVVRAQVALEEATQDARDIRDAEAAMAEQDALQETEAGLTDARENENVQAAAAKRQKSLQQAQQTLQQQTSDAEEAEPTSPFAGRPADQLSSTLRP